MHEHYIRGRRIYEKSSCCSSLYRLWHQYLGKLLHISLLTKQIIIRIKRTVIILNILYINVLSFHVQHIFQMGRTSNSYWVIVRYTLVFCHPAHLHLSCILWTSTGTVHVTLRENIASIINESSTITQACCMRQIRTLSTIFNLSSA